MSTMGDKTRNSDFLYHKTFISDMANSAPTLGVSLQGEFEEMKSFRLAMAKYSLVHGTLPS
jgi:hypothetical protein